MLNPNDSTADIYDQFTLPLKGQEVTAAELRLFNELLKPHAQILDIGGGTGRHAIPLAQAGHNITVVDSSQAMLHRLHKKMDQLELKGSLETMQQSIIHYNPPAGIYDLVIMMWNAFNEIALTDRQAELVLRKSRDALAAGGKIVINIDDTSRFLLPELKFSTENTVANQTYIQDWEVIKFDPDTNTTVSRETITVRDEHGKNLRREINDITQRWWDMESIEKIAFTLGMSVEKHSITNNEELYLVLTRTH